MKNNMKLAVYAMAVVLIMSALLGLVACDKGCDHQWQDATCTAPKTCKLCSETEGKPVAHTGGTATCTQKAACSVCGTEYGDVSEHEWVDATCAQPKHCANCTATEGSVADQTQGNAPTCTEKATCSVCGEAYGELGGHTYDQAVVADTALKSAATCESAAVYYKSCTCGAVSTNDADVFTDGEALSHVYDQAVVTDAALKSAATCESAAVYYKSCTCGAVSTNDSDVFTDGNATEHQFSEAWNQNNAEHWRTCACGEKTNVAPHVFENASVTKHPTCVADGESTATCVCGMTQTSALPATGEHTYVNGACSGCGKQEAVTCDHSVLHEEIIDLAAHGACKGYMYYNTCDCGEVVLFDLSSDMNFTCDFSSYEETESEDEYGNEVYNFFASCANCGLEFTAVEHYGSIGCVEFDRATVSLDKNGKSLIKDALWEETEIDHEGDEPVNVDVSQFGACGGTIKVWNCIHCGENCDIEIESDQLLCPIDFESDTIPEEFVDAQGNTHVRYTLTCPDCGLKLIREEWIEEFSTCEEIYHEEMYVICGDNVIFEHLYEEYEVEHEYDYTCEILGDTCGNGMRLTLTCNDCGHTFTRIRFNHISSYRNIDFYDLGMCGGYIEEEYCIACDTLLHVWENNYCDWSYIGMTDDDYSVYECHSCGALRYIKYTDYEIDENCEYTQVVSCIYFMGDEEIYRYKSSDRNVSHEYEYTYDMWGDTCEDGYTVIETCIRCGSTYTWESERHDSEYRTIDLSEYGMCDGYIEERYCIVCDTVLDVWINDDCWFAFTGETTQDGFEVYECRDCGAIAHEHVIQSEIDENCEYTETVNQIYFKNGKEIYRYEWTNTDSDHEYEYTYDMWGDTCEDGYTIIGTCIRCGDTYTWEDEGHDSEYRTIDLSEYGMCGGYIEERYCIVCDTILDVWINDDCWFEFTGETTQDGFDVYACEDCGAIVHEHVIQSEIDENCEYTETVNQIYFKNGEEIYRYEWTNTDSDHEYEYTYDMWGDTCEDGYTIIGTCIRCGDTYTWEDEGHDFDYRYIDLSEYGLCGGYAEETYCPVCDTVLDVWIDYNCWFEFTGETTQDGFDVYACEDCETVTHYYYDEETEILIFFKNGVEILRFTYIDSE